MLWALPITAHGLRGLRLRGQGSELRARRGEGRAGGLSGQKRSPHEQFLFFAQHRKTPRYTCKLSNNL